MQKIIFLLLFIFILTGCSNSSKISPQDAKEMLDSNEDVILVDVRTYSEYIEKRIPGSILISVDKISELAKTRIPDKNKTYIIYCRSGNRSAIATKTLKDLGYKNVYDLGGIQSWPYETTSGA